MNTGEGAIATKRENKISLDVVGSEESRFCLVVSQPVGRLTSESVQGASLTLQGIDDVHGGDRLPLGVLGVGDGISDDVLKEDLEDASGLLVDESGDTLHSSAAGQTPDGGLGDALDVIAQHLPVPLGASLSKSFAPFATSRHDEYVSVG